MGYVLLKTGDITGGKKHYNVLTEILRRLITIEPNNINWLEAYYSNLRKIANILHEQGGDDILLIAINHYKEAIKTLQHLIELEPNEHEWYRYKSECYNELGDTYLSYGDRNTSERCYKDATLKMNSLPKAVVEKIFPKEVLEKLGLDKFIDKAPANNENQE